MPNSLGEQPKADAAAMFNWVAAVVSHAERTGSDSGPAAGDAAQDGRLNQRRVSIQNWSQQHPKFKAAKGSYWGSKPPGDHRGGEINTQYSVLSCPHGVPRAPNTFNLSVHPQVNSVRFLEYHDWISMERYIRLSKEPVLVARGCGDYSAVAKLPWR